MPSRQSTALLAGCQHWEWKNGSFKNSFSLSVRASGYIGNLGTVCSNEDIISPDANCVSPNIEEDIKTLSLAAEMTEVSRYIHLCYYSHSYLTTLFIII